MVAKRMDDSVRRRVRAGRLLLAGKTPAQAAQAVGVARQTAYTWKAVLDDGGIDALRAMPPPGRPARLDDEQLRALGRTLLQRPTAHGFTTELWTLKRVGVLIERLYGVKFGQTQIWRILGGLGFSVQKPERRAIERNEQAVRTWKRETWPALKKRPNVKGD
jgi:transposase